MTTRENWLLAVAHGMAPQFAALDYELPPFRITCGFPSRAATARTKRRIGECWIAAASEDEHHEILISPILIDPMEIAGVIAHELVHAVLPPNTGHKGKFPSICKALGLVGKPTSTMPGETFRATVEPLLRSAGDYPHARLNVASDTPKKQGTRMIKCECGECGYTVRTTAKWLNAGGPPLCPCNSEPMSTDN